MNSPSLVCMQSVWFGLPLLLLTACNNDHDWRQQFEAVQSGGSNTIALQDRAITRTQLASLEQIDENLFDLLLDAGGAADVDLSQIANLSRLEHLRIRESRLTDQGLKRLSGGRLQTLRILNLPQAQITREGIRHLQLFPNLTQLRLGGPGLDDDAVLEMARLPALKSLHLIGPSLSEQALDHLAEAPRLASFYLDDCPLPDDAWQRLFEAKPQLHVHIDQQHHDRDPHLHPH